MVGHQKLTFCHKYLGLNKSASQREENCNCLRKEGFELKRAKPAKVLVHRAIEVLANELYFHS